MCIYVYVAECGEVGVPVVVVLIRPAAWFGEDRDSTTGVAGTSCPSVLCVVQFMKPSLTSGGFDAAPHT